MGEPQFTPGPWEAEVRGLHVSVSAGVHPDRQDVGRWYVGLQREATARANAALIEAAPDLFGECAMIEDLLNTYCIADATGHAGMQRDAAQALVNRIMPLRALLAKARGEKADV